MHHLPHRRFLIAGLLVLTPAAFATAEEELPKLGEQLQAISAGFAEKAPAAMRQAFAQGITDVEATGILGKALNVGDKAADGTLLDDHETPVRLSELWSERPLVLTFYRGGWCPYCNVSLRAMEQANEKLRSAGARVVAVTPELPEYVMNTRSQNSLSITILSDKGNQLARKMGIVFRLPEVILPIYKKNTRLEQHNGDENYELPLAATYVIDTEGVIRYAFLDADYKKRAEPAEVLAAVKGL